MASKSRERARLALAAATVTALCVGGVSLAQGGGTAHISTAADITTGSVTHNWTVVRGRTKATTLKVSGISPASAKVTVLCHGGGCPYKSKTFKAKAGKANLLSKPLKRAKLKAGANLAILIVAPGTTGRYLSFDMRAKAIPAIKTGCAAANSLNPVGCPGPQGPQGVAGKNGAAGARGATGARGPAGSNATAMWAVINADGTRARGSHVVSSAAIGTTGSYEVVFDRDVTGCSYQATLGGASGDTYTGFVSVARRSGKPNGVFLITSNSAATGTQTPFHLAVFC